MKYAVKSGVSDLIRRVEGAPSSAQPHQNLHICEKDKFGRWRSFPPFLYLLKHLSVTLGPTKSQLIELRGQTWA